ASLRLDAAHGAREAEAMAALVGSKVGRGARFVSQEAIQLHGAMGVCEETPIPAIFRRLTAFGALAGSAMSHSLTYGRNALRANQWRDSIVLGPGPASTGAEADALPLGTGLPLDQGLQEFRRDVRAFIDANLTDAMRQGQAMTSGVYPEPEVAVPWQRALARQGWLVPLWPKE